MTFQNLETVLDGAVASLSARLPLMALSAGPYASMRYPKFPAFMRFTVKRFAAAGFGNVFSMYTRALGGAMQLCTLVCTPNAGADVPLLLLDVMAMGKKRAAFVEYYDCTKNGAVCPGLKDVRARYAALPDYPEKPAWYVSERTADSLIKGGTDDAALLAMLTDSVAAYADACGGAACSPENLAGLSAFIDRMGKDGNPSSATVEKVLGKPGADRFFKAAVMPGEYTENDL